MLELMPEAWRGCVDAGEPWFAALERAVREAYETGVVYPRPEELFAALHAVGSPERVRVVIVAQDPYVGEGEAHGLAFSVRAGVRLPPSLRNIFKELAADGFPERATTKDGDLTAWAQQGVLLLNSALSVRAGKRGSHGKLGWAHLTDAVLRAVNAASPGVAFALWGRPARKKAVFVDTSKHALLEAAHPSPLSASRGFFGSRPFSKMNAFLTQRYGEGGGIQW